MPAETTDGRIDGRVIVRAGDVDLATTPDLDAALRSVTSAGRPTDGAG